MGWPDTLRSWDILFLIPMPWVAPVWAPLSVATFFVAAGSYLFWTVGVSAALSLARHRYPGRFGAPHNRGLPCGVERCNDQRIPERFPVWLFVASVALGVGWFP